MSSVLPGVLLATLVPSLPAVVVLVAWSEAGQRIVRQFGARMVWELAAGVAVAIGLLLYMTVGLASDDGAGIAAISLGAICGVLGMTAVAPRLHVKSSALRVTLAIGVAVIALQLGFVVGLVGYWLVWPPQ